MSKASNAMPSGTLFMLVGPGGVGKNALMKELLQRTDRLKQLPTATTRRPRDGEVDGVHHLFLTLEAFQNLIDSNALLEHQEVHPGKFYGVPRATLEEIIKNGQQCIADIEFKGATVIKEAYPQDSIAIFIAPPTYETLSIRLEDRKATIDQINERLARVSAEMLYAPNCDYVVVNDDMETAVAELYAIIKAECENTIQATSPQIHAVSYTVEVLPVFNDEILVQKSSSAFPSATLNKGENPETVAAQILEKTLSVTPIASALSYGVPGLNRPVVFNYEPGKRRYALTFRYTYRLMERITTPEGWQWMPYAQVMED